MGGANSKSIFEYSYQKERSELRKALILSFIDNPENKTILSKISAVRSLIVEHPEICATAAKEAEHEFEYSPTSIEAAYNELERLFTIYETSTILKSVQCRVGSVACPLGHHAPYFEVLTPHNSTTTEKKKGNKGSTCGICDKHVNGGYQCSYCAYNLCVTCSTIYCCNGHAMKLWTHPEAQHKCVVCNTEPVTSGYRCTICTEAHGEYDICDYCTYKPGRKAVQQVILDRMAVDLLYLEKHVTESETAMNTVTLHKKKLESNSYPSTLQLYEFSLTVNDLRIVSTAEVRQSRITKEVRRLRAILTIGQEYCATARREALIDGNFTVEEIERLTILVTVSDREKTPAVRNLHIVACPMGHAAKHFVGRPTEYMKRDSLLASQKHIEVTAVCKLCDRVAAPEGYHCDFCEYDLCSTCAVIFCVQGHPMIMWTVPDAMTVCCRCSTEMSRGYHCNVCSVDMCDLCTAKEGRGGVRNAWEAEMKQLLLFMKTNKRLSDIASYYHWRSKNYIVSTGLLCEYVKELRMAKARAEKQIAQKPIIDRIKELRLEVVKNVDLCVTAAREAAKSPEYIFSSKRMAALEASRLQSLLDQSSLLKTTKLRAEAGIACPLGHAAKLMTVSTTPPCESPPDGGDSDRLLIMETTGSSLDDTYTLQLPSSSSPSRIPAFATSGGSVTLLSNTNTLDVLSNTEIDVNLHSFVDEFQLSSVSLPSLKRACRICATTELTDSDGNCMYHSCSYCEYDLCVDCSTVYCRQSHPLRIWTMPDAVSLACDMCKRLGITSGYRCLECNVDICDMCTTKDCRNAFMFWPRREITKLLVDFEDMKNDSHVIQDYFHKQNQKLNASNGKMKANNGESMSKLCKRLKELTDLKQLVSEELQRKKSRAQAKKYGLHGSDM